MKNCKGLPPETNWYVSCKYEPFVIGLLTNTLHKFIDTTGENFIFKLDIKNGFYNV